MRAVILDCDIASCLAKVDRVYLLKRAFLASRIIPDEIDTFWRIRRREHR